MRVLSAILFAVLSVGVANASTDLKGLLSTSDSKRPNNAHIYIYEAFPRTGFSSFCPSCYRDCGKHVDVNDKGEFVVKNLDDSLVFNVLAVAKGYEPTLTQHVDPRKGTAAIVLAPRARQDALTITGTVIAADGKPAVGAVIEPNGYHTYRIMPDGRRVRAIRYGYAAGVDKIAIADQEGKFVLHIPEGDGQLDIRVCARGNAPQIVRELVPQEERTIRLVAGGAISGRLVRGSAPLAGIRVGVVQENRGSSNYLGRADIATDDKGFFTIANLAVPNRYVVYVPMADMRDGAVEPITVDVASETNTVDVGTLQVVKSRTIRGSICVPDGYLIPPHTRVTVEAEIAADGKDVEIRPDGTFVIDGLPNDELSLHAQLPGLNLLQGPAGSPLAQGGISVPRGNDSSDLDLVFQK
jgi:hypothetical protein